MSVYLDDRLSSATWDDQLRSANSNLTLPAQIPVTARAAEHSQ
jgi:hypothetical protein